MVHVHNADEKRVHFRSFWKSSFIPLSQEMFSLPSALLHQTFSNTCSAVYMGVDEAQW